MTFRVDSKFGVGWSKTLPQADLASKRMNVEKRVADGQSISFDPLRLL